MPENNSSLFLNISAFTLDDVQEAVELHKLSFEEFWSEQLFTNLIQNVHVYGFLAYSSCPQPLGFLLGQITPGEAEIYTLATHPHYRRQGVACHLIEKWITLCIMRDVKRILLEVNEMNTPAVKFYEEMGFRVYGRRTNYYRSSSHQYNDALLFAFKVK